MYNLKTIILVSLCLQNAGYTLLRKYTTKYENVSSKEILLLSEIFKVIFSIYMVFQSEGTNTNHSEKAENDIIEPQGRGWARIMWLIQHSYKMLVLAIIYGVMNILSFVALQYIGAGEFTICAQLKILSTALCSVIVLGTSLSWTKWRALILLVLGCILVASPVFTHTGSVQPGNHRNLGNEVEVPLSLQLFGYAAVLFEVILSGFASIYFEKVVKSQREIITIWERNIQLGYYSIIIYGAIMIYEGMFPAVGSFPRAAFSGWSSVTLLVTMLGATGGLLVAATLKYADSILKTLAAAGAIVLSTILGHYFLNGPLDAIVSIGALVTIISIANYTFDTTN